MSCFESGPPEGSPPESEASTPLLEVPEAEKEKETRSRSHGSGQSVVWKLLVGSILVGFLISSAVRGSFNKSCVTGQGPIAKREIDVLPFASIEAGGSFNVYITPAEKHQVSVESNANIIDRMKIETMNGELTIGTKSGCVSAGTLNVYVETPELERLVTRGSGDVHTQGIFGTSNGAKKTYKSITTYGSGDTSAAFENVDIMTIQMLGSGDLKLKGNCVTNHVKSVGSGDLKALKFQSQETAIAQVGSGDSQIAVNQTLTVYIFGSGDVKYKGDPKITSNIYGSGEVIHVGSSM